MDLSGLSCREAAGTFPPRLCLLTTKSSVGQGRQKIDVFHSLTLRPLVISTVTTVHFSNCEKH
jgi:hypothetical protein